MVKARDRQKSLDLPVQPHLRQNAVRETQFESDPQHPPCVDEETVVLTGKVTWLKVPEEHQAERGWKPGSRGSGGPEDSEEEVTYFSLS